MLSRFEQVIRLPILFWLGWLVVALCPLTRAAQAPQMTSSNYTLRIMAANLTGSSQKYEAPALRIFQGLKPDIVAIQEFNYSNNTASDFRAMVDQAFGTNYSYYRETGSYSIPNGVISRYPLRSAGSWDDPLIPDRGFAWARIAIPGTNDLYVVSVHLKASAGTTESQTRSNEAVQIKGMIATNFPTNAWIVVAGDCNAQSRNEMALTIFRTFLSDTPIPADGNGDPDTNTGRDKPYDYVLPSFNFSSNLVPVKVGSSTFNNGLVFDSRVYSPLSEVSPVQSADSGTAQHMAVIKDFRITFPVTNWVEVPPPNLVLGSGSTIRWTGPSNLSYQVLRSTNLTSWASNQTVSSSTTNYSFTAPRGTNRLEVYRVAY